MFRPRIVLAALLATLLALVPTAVARAEQITVAAAISLKEAVTEIADAYKADTGDEVKFTFGSSGQLAAQVKNGAPIDAFISAANKQVDDLAKDKLADEAGRRVVAGNTLVLIVPAKAAAGGNTAPPPAGFAALADPAVRKVAVGEPRTVPAGQYALQVLKALKIDEKLADRTVYGANVRQVLDYVRRAEVDAGIVYATDAREAGEEVRVVATADPKTHEPIVYPAVVVTASRKRDAARKFLDHLGGDKARKVLEAKGFTTGEVPAGGGEAGKRPEK